MHSEAGPDYSRALDIRRLNIAELPISLPTSLISRAESLRRPSAIPKSSGVSFWYFRDIPSVVPTFGCSTLNGCTLLYLGIAPDRTRRSASLFSSITRNYRGNVEGSSLRRTLALLLQEKSRMPLLTASGARTVLTAGGKRWLDHWMDENTFVGWTEHPEPRLIEYELLRKLPLPLNTAHNGHHPFASVLKRMRLDALERARALSIASEQNQVG